MQPSRKKLQTHLKRPILESELKAVAEVSCSMQDAANQLGVHILTLRKYAVMFNMLGDFKKKSKLKRKYSLPKNAYNIDDIAAGKYPRYNPSFFMERVFRCHRKHRQCERCGHNERRIDGKVALKFHYIDGNHKNWNYDNIKVLCYNCYFNIEGNFSGHKMSTKSKGFNKYKWGWEAKEDPIEKKEVKIESTPQVNLSQDNSLLSEEEMENIRREVEEENKK